MSALIRTLPVLCAGSDRSWRSEGGERYIFIRAQIRRPDWRYYRRRCGKPCADCWALLFV